MVQKIRQLMSLGILAAQIFIFWLAVGYGSFLFIMSFPVSAHELTPNTHWVVPHEQLFIYAEVTTLVSIAIALIVWWVQQRTAKMQLIRLYRQHNDRSEPKQNIAKK